MLENFALRKYKKGDLPIVRRLEHIAQR